MSPKKATNPVSTLGPKDALNASNTFAKASEKVKGKKPVSKVTRKL